MLFRVPEKNEKDKKGGLWLAETRGKRLLNNFSSLKSTKKEKLHYVSSRANDVRPLSRRRQHTCSAYVSIPLQDKTPSPVNSQKKKSDALFAFSFAHAAAKEKISKRKRQVEISRSAERDKSSALLIAPPSPKGGRKLCYSGRKL